MQEGWYCRTLANQMAATTHNNQDDDENDPNVADSGSDDSQDGAPGNFNNEIDYKVQYIYLKQKLKFLLYENEFFQDALRSSQRRLLKVSRDRSFLLDRLLQYEKPDPSSSESDETESSDEESSRVEIKKRKLDTTGSNGTVKPAGRKKKVIQQKPKQPPMQVLAIAQQNLPQEGHMTAEEVERHLQSRQSITELVPERAPPTVPTEMFSNEPSLDSESNDQMIETSPSNMGEDCLSVDMSVVKCEFNS